MIDGASDIAAAIGQLTHAADVLDRQNDPGDRRVAAALRGIAAGADPCDALRLRLAPGELSIATTKMLDRRNDLVVRALVLCAALLRADGKRDSANACARMLHSRLGRYRAAGWRRERDRPAAPDDGVDSLRPHLWAILRADDRLLSAETLRKIWSANGPFHDQKYGAA